MERLSWRPVPGGFEADGYRIRLLLAHLSRSWMLETGERGATLSGSAAWSPVSRHRTLGSARARAAGMEADRLRRQRMRIRVIVGTVSASVSLAVVPFVTSLAGYVVAVLAFGLALRAFGDAATIRLGHAWDWVDEPRITVNWLDRVGFRTAKVLHEGAAARLGDEGDPRIRVLPPLPPEDRRLQQ
jgi:hypothetical protein